MGEVGAVWPERAAFVGRPWGLGTGGVPPNSTDAGSINAAARCTLGYADNAEGDYRD